MAAVQTVYNAAVGGGTLSLLDTTVDASGHRSNHGYDNLLMITPMVSNSI